jgi:hypothetical protein
VKRTAVDDSVGRLSGYIEGKTFVRRVSPGSDMLITRKAYALDDSVLDRLVDEGVEIIVLQEPNRRLVSEIEDWQDLGQDYNRAGVPMTTLKISLMGAK